MDKRIKITIIGTAVMLLVILTALGLVIKNKLTPSNEVMLLTDYYHVEDSEVMLILQDEIYDKPGLLIEDTVYIDLDTIVNYFNHRFYWDSKEKLLTLTTPTQILRAEADSKRYTVISKETTEVTAEAPVFRIKDSAIYISLDFVKAYSDITARFYKEPNRVIIEYIWDEYLFTEVEKDTQLRLEPDIKSPILAELVAGQELLFVDLDEPIRKGYYKVMTYEGIIGYVKGKHTIGSYSKQVNGTFIKPEYTAQTRPEKINLVFHQVFGPGKADELESYISQTKGVNVVSPTWYSIQDNSGAFTSLANQEYVDKAKELGLEVWALIDDFSPEVNMRELLSNSSARDKLTDALIAEALQYGLEGINIDFEKIPEDAGEHYIQFLRELSAKCRNYGIVLSVDNFVPPFKKHYDKEEQGKILDYLIVMAYDEFYAGSETAGPNSSIGFVEDALNGMQKLVPKEKIIMSIPFYSRLWKETAGGEVFREKDYAMTPAEQVLADNEAKAVWNDTYGSFYAEYEKDGAVYKMWQEEEKSIEEKMKAIKAADVAGVAAWKLGLEKPEVWDVITGYLK